MADIFRSIAHEMTNIKQYELDEIPENYGKQKKKANQTPFRIAKNILAAF